MPNDRTKVRFGVGKLYSAVVGATEPALLATPWAVAWTHLGYTDEGSSFTASPDFEDIEVAEEVNAIDIIKTGEELTVEFALAQLTAENLQLVLNGGTITANNPRTITVGTTSSSATITSAALFDTTLDVGASITGTGIPASTTILSVATASSATISANATATGSPSVVINRLTGEKTYEPPAADATPTYIALGWQSDNSKERYVWRKCLQSGDIEVTRRKGSDKATLPAEFRVIQPTSGAPWKYWVSDS